MPDLVAKVHQIHFWLGLRPQTLLGEFMTLPQKNFADPNA